jgi:hypothetical protein
MTEKQAYKILTNTPIRAKENHAEYSKALHVAIGALQKQIPARAVPVHTRVGVIHLLQGYKCPNCDTLIGGSDGNTRSYCDLCGQTLLWGGDNL